jgi:hypothetical protein
LNFIIEIEGVLCEVELRLPQDTPVKAQKEGDFVASPYLQPRR